MQQLEALTREVSGQFAQRSDLCEAIKLALLTGQHVYAVGPPGTAKSAVARAFLNRVEGANVFEAQFSKSKTDQQVLGPVHIPTLRDQGELVRNTTGYLPEADLAVLDELARASATVADDMLAILNERIFHHPRPVAVPLHTAVATANSIPEDDLGAALWDRLLFRVPVGYVEDADEWLGVITAPPIAPATTTVHLQDVRLAAAEATEVTVPADFTPLVELRMKLADEGIRPSDRRWKASVGVMRAAAYVAGRDSVAAEDLSPLRFTLWSAEDEFPRVCDVVMALAAPEQAKVDKAKRELDQLFQDTLEAFKTGDFTRAIAEFGEARKSIVVPELEDYADDLKRQLVEAALG